MYRLFGACVLFAVILLAGCQSKSGETPQKQQTAPAPGQVGALTPGQPPGSPPNTGSMPMGTGALQPGRAPGGPMSAPMGGR